MGLRFQKRIKIVKGFYLNLSKTGLSFSVGQRGATVNVRNDKVTGNVGLPGSGLSYRKIIASKKEQLKAGNTKLAKWWSILFVIIVLALVAYHLVQLFIK